MPIRRVSPQSREADDVTRAHPQTPLLRPPPQAPLDPRPALPSRRDERVAGGPGRAGDGVEQRVDGARLDAPPALVRPGLAGLAFPASPSALRSDRTGAIRAP